MSNTSAFLGKNIFSRFVSWFKALPVRNGWLAFLLLHLAVLLAGLESAYVQVATTYQFFSFELLKTPSFLFLLSLDLLVPLMLAVLSRRVFFLYLAGHCLLNIILLHYRIFFYNPLTLSTIYHSMQGAATLGIDILGFARWNIIAIVICFFFVKVFLVQLSRAPDSRMPRLWALRGAIAVSCLAIAWWISMIIHGQTGLSALWVDSRGHRTATERRLESGTREAVRNIGYLATWLGECMSGTYRDTALIYAEMRCREPGNEHDCPVVEPEPACALRNEKQSDSSPQPNAPEQPVSWNGLPLPPKGPTVIFVQVESLDFEMLSMRVNGHTVLPFIDFLAQESLVLKTFAPHKVGSSNSDYEILNSRIADQNVMYYSYIQEYPDSVIRLLQKQGYRPGVFHGLSGKLFNLREAYKAQGFERFFFKEELEQAGYGPSKYIMDHIMDEDVFAKATEELAADSAQAQFIITMTSHIPFIDPLPIFKRAGGVFARYVSSLRYLDQSLAAFYAQLPAGALLVIWGDHGSDVEYPQGFAENKRHVPFIAHVKGNVSWLKKINADKKRNEAATYPFNKDTFSDPIRAQFYPIGRQQSPFLAEPRIYTLCELSYYLRAMLRCSPEPR